MFSEIPTPSISSILNHAVVQWVQELELAFAGLMLSVHIGLWSWMKWTALLSDCWEKTLHFHNSLAQRPPCLTSSAFRCCWGLLFPSWNGRYGVSEWHGVCVEPFNDLALEYLPSEGQNLALLAAFWEGEGTWQSWLCVCGFYQWEWELCAPAMVEEEIPKSLSWVCFNAWWNKKRELRQINERRLMGKEGEREDLSYSILYLFYPIFVVTVDFGGVHSWHIPSSVLRGYFLWPPGTIWEETRAGCMQSKCSIHCTISPVPWWVCFSSSTSGWITTRWNLKTRQLILPRTSSTIVFNRYKSRKVESSLSQFNILCRGERRGKNGIWDSSSSHKEHEKRKKKQEGR